MTIPSNDPAAQHPERICGRCAGPNIAWSAPSPLWNAVMRGGSINGTEEFNGIVCPTCFAILAEERGIAQLWQFSAQRVLVELETVTPSGRVWDAQAWMWREPDPVKVRAAATGGGPCRCGKPLYTHVCLGCSPDAQTPGPGCINCRSTGMDQTPCKPAEAVSDAG